MPRRKTVYIIHTGGTIGMAKTPDGYAPGSHRHDMVLTL